MSRVVCCPISGKSFAFSADYFNKKIEEYGTVENLKRYFVTKKVKALINRGYSAQEIRNIIDVSSENLQSVESQEVKDVMGYYELKNKSISKKLSSNFSTGKSDPDVVKFINNIRNYE